jgi:hypothetical protein
MMYLKISKKIVCMIGMMKYKYFTKVNNIKL